MPLITPSSLQSQYDVIVVGTGAGGGQAAYTLALEGVKVLLLEAGRNYVPETETPMFQTPDQAPLRAASTPDKRFGFYDATVDGGWTVPGEPYTSGARKPDDGRQEAGSGAGAPGSERDSDSERGRKAEIGKAEAGRAEAARPGTGTVGTVEGKPGTVGMREPGEGEFWWWRSRMLGGRTNHWGRYSFRNGPYDFKPYTRDGLGFDWPISYEDLAPYYDKVEMLIGVYGDNNGLENTPDSPAGCLLPPPAGRVHDLLVQKHAKTLGIPIIAARRAVMTTRLDDKNLPAKLHPGNPTAQRLVREAMQGRQACFWATDCGRGCSIRANYQSTTVHLPPAMASGNMDLVTDAMVREVTLGANGKADGVIFIDRTTGKEQKAKARVVVLAASACESVRILLNSKPTGFERGLGNSSGLVGRYVMDTVGSGLGGQIPALENLPPHNDFGASGGHMYAPWWLYQQQLAGKLGFARGYHIEFGGSRGMPSLSTFSGIEWLTGGSYGAKFKEDARRYYGSFIGFAGRGEMIPNANSYCELDPQVKDKWGIPVLRFQWRWSDHETRQAAHMQKTFAEIIRAMGGKLKQPPELNGEKAIDPPGSIIHEVGGTIMGDDPTKSVTNQWCQLHDVKNVFLTDGAPFPSNADKNPTLTIMALAWRTADRIAAELKRGNL